MKVSLCVRYEMIDLTHLEVDDKMIIERFGSIEEFENQINDFDTYEWLKDGYETEEEGFQFVDDGLSYNYPSSKGREYIEVVKGFVRPK